MKRSLFGEPWRMERVGPVQLGAAMALIAGLFTACTSWDDAKQCRDLAEKVNPALAEIMSRAPQTQQAANAPEIEAQAVRYRALAENLERLAATATRDELRLQLAHEFKAVAGILHAAAEARQHEKPGAYARASMQLSAASARLAALQKRARRLCPP